MRMPCATHGGLLSLLAMAVTILLATGVAARLRMRVPAAIGWSEAAWQLPLDNWGQGRAWHGPGDLRLFARTKSGFCNCFNGIANDEEIDRIGDVDLHAADFSPSAPGVSAAVGDLPGRKRLFRTKARWANSGYVLSIVAANDCKAVVATIVSNDVISADAEASAVKLLTSETFRQWAANQQ